MDVHTEIRFEEAIEQHLLSKAGGYAKGDAKAFDARQGLFPNDVVSFIQATQQSAWKAIASYHGANAGQAVLDDLAKALSSPAIGLIHVLRQGFTCFGKTLRVAYFAPANLMNPENAKQYAANRLTVTRQVCFSDKNGKLSIDVVLALNGLPVATLELKNPLTHQNVHDAMRQYRNDRDPREPLLRFKERALVHFAVDPDLVYMTTKLDGKATRFLPFNRGDAGGAGNAPNPNGYRTAYLWEDVLKRDSLLDILGRFIQLEKIERDVLIRKGGKETVQKIRKESVIFPRFHQLDAVRKLTGAAYRQGTGHNYLVQHSAGSGKSNTIAWLAHRLSTLHDEKDTKVFDSVIVITDRRVLDRQLQDTVYQFEHKGGVVKKIDEDSAQLANALIDRTPIIITTLQKFPFVTEKIGTLPSQRYAVIVDEAHSSQSGEQAGELKRILNDAALRAKAKALAQEEGNSEDNSDNEAMLLTMLSRGRQQNISFFAFTATPKFKTLKIFDEAGPSGRAPFHLYTMRQAIEEGFILDVLRNYTTYKAYYKLIETATEDPLVEKKEAAKALARFLRHHPHNLASKVEVMVEHFRAHARHKIGGRAKAMVVTDSRLAAVRYKQAFDKYIKDKDYRDIRTLVAFSGVVEDPDFKGQTYSEQGMNSIPESQLAERFETEEYQVLIVAEKYQTGFDQPLLHSMYVDKRLDGVQAVQTLSRLNRIHAGKEDTFVLDFYNEREDIFRAFKPYYEATAIEEEIDAHKLYELKAKLDGARVYFEVDVATLCTVFFNGGEDAGIHAKLYKLLDPVVERFKALEETEQDDFRGWLQSFRNLYGFLSQVIPYQDSALEALHTYLRFLGAKLPLPLRGKPLEIDDDVQLKFYRLQKIAEGQISLAEGDAPGLRGPSEVGGRRSEPEQVALSSLIEQLNERFGTDFRPADQLFFDQIEADAVDREDIQEAAIANSIDNFRLLFEKELEGLFVDRMEGNDEIFRRVMQDEQFRAAASAYLINKVYEKARSSGPPRE
ncbi:MAG: type I restriction endonuclease [Burkholderiaceae bacterium]|jgi:type I restriction enzyme R subunit|nr:type I restriction endonuclease [Burkholderiaceae bacterium]